MGKDAIPFADVQRVLVIKLRHHGDVLLSSPVFSALRRAAEHCEVDALVYAETAPMLQDHPAISHLHCIDRSWKSSGWRARASAEWSLLQTLRARRYDLVVHLTEHTRGAWLTRILKPRWSVAYRRPGRAGSFWGNSFTHIASRAPARRHAVEVNLDALRRLGLVIDAADKRVVLVPGAAAEAKVAALLDANGLSARPFVHLHPGSRWQFKCWPAARFAELCHYLHAHGLPLVLTGAPDAAERRLIDEIVKRLADIPTTAFLDLTGSLSLRELAALTARARLFVGVDSAPMHIAAAMDTPTVALFGPSGDIEWGPWQVRRRIVASQTHPCRPCGLDGCGSGKISECLTELPVESVIAACDALLA